MDAEITLTLVLLALFDLGLLAQVGRSRRRSECRWNRMMQSLRFAVDQELRTGR
jgi:hypothetical protein